MDRTELEQRLLDRAIEDQAFRARLLADPRHAIAEELGDPLPEHLAIEVLEERPGTMYLVLPSVELEDDALDAVTGGTGASAIDPRTGTSDPIHVNWHLA